MSGWHPILRVGVLLNLACGVYVAVGVLADSYGSVGLVLVVAAWVVLAVAAQWHGRRVLFALLVVTTLPMTIGLAVLLDQPCDLAADGSGDVEGGHWDWWFPPADACRVEQDGAVRYERPWLGAFTPSFGWAVLAAWLVVARRPAWYWRCVLIAATWLVAMFVLLVSR